MRLELAQRRVLVLGGTGAVGRAVLKSLAAKGVAADFTYHENRDLAQALAAEYGFKGHRVDFRDPQGYGELFAALEADVLPNTLIQCAAQSAALGLAAIDLQTWSSTFAINVDSSYRVCQWFLQQDGPADVVLLSGLDRGQSLPLPVHFAASQGAVTAMSMALAHEFASADKRINSVVLGVLDEGLAAGLDPKTIAAFETFSALRRKGSAEEAARAIVWLALENDYMNGKVMTLNGGL